MIYEQLSDALRELEQVKAERDALAALLAQVKNTLAAPMSMEWRISRAIDHLLSETPATSLARLKAEWKAEGAQLAADSIRYEYEGEIHQDRIADHADGVAEKLRRQAEEGRDD